MSEYRISFLCDIDKSLVKRTWASFLKVAVQHNILPSKMFKTGSSKKNALKHAVDLLNAESVSIFLDRVLNDRNWPDFVVSSLWAENQTGGDGFQISFDSDLFGSQNVFFTILKTPDSNDVIFDQFLKDLRLTVECDVIVSKFDGYTPKILVINEREDTWVDRLASPKEYKRIQRRTGFSPK